MHINLHKTFSTPQWQGGGHGAGPVVFYERLAPFAPLRSYVHDRTASLHRAARTRAPRGSALRPPSCAFHGQMGMFVRASAICLSHGADVA